MKVRTWLAISITSNSGRKRRDIAARNRSLSGKNRPSRNGVKPSLIGLNGPVSVTCNPSAARFSPELSVSSAAASSLPKCGAATMMDVALMRPREINSRIAALTPGEIP